MRPNKPSQKIAFAEPVASTNKCGALAREPYHTSDLVIGKLRLLERCVLAPANAYSVSSAPRSRLSLHGPRMNADPC